MKLDTEKIKFLISQGEGYNLALTSILTITGLPLFLIGQLKGGQKGGQKKA